MDLNFVCVFESNDERIRLEMVRMRSFNIDEIHNWRGNQRLLPPPIRLLSKRANERKMNYDRPSNIQRTKKPFEMLNVQPSLFTVSSLSSSPLNPVH